MDIKRQVDQASVFRQSVRAQKIANGLLKREELISQLVSPDHLMLFSSTSDSLRRETAWLRVARTVADLESSPKISLSHLVEAHALAIAGPQTIAQLWRNT